MISPNADSPTPHIAQFADQLERIEVKLDELLRREQTQPFYSTGDVARILSRAEWTVREWCRHGRVHAEKRLTGRGTTKEWMISHDELQRIQSEGLLPAAGTHYPSHPLAQTTTER